MRHNKLVRDFETDQKKAVDQAAKALGISSSRFCRDAAIKVAGGRMPADSPLLKVGAAAQAPKKTPPRKSTPGKRRQP